MLGPIGENMNFYVSPAVEKTEPESVMPVRVASAKSTWGSERSSGNYRLNRYCRSRSARYAAKFSAAPTNTARTMGPTWREANESS